MSSKVFPLILMSLIAAAPLAADSPILVEIEDLEPGDLAVRGFELRRAGEIQIEALGIGVASGKKRVDVATAWILDAESREVVWDMAKSDSSDRRRGLREYEDELRLEAGTYEVYYSTYPTYRSSRHDGWWESTARSMGRIFGWSDEDDYEDAIEDLMLTVRGQGRAVAREKLHETRHQLREQAIVALEAEDDSSVQEAGFELEKPMTVLVYALGELGKPDDAYDYGWIVDTETREKVWTLNWRESKPAGGAHKNRAAYDAIELPAGKYAAFFVTDGSHSPERWNALPPHDPAFWGLTVWTESKEDLKFAKAFEYRHLPDDDRVLVELDRMRDGEYESQGFTLAEPMDVRIYALGEGFSRGMADYGWIVDARTREKIWVMSYDKTQHGGGGSKNRQVDEIIRLDAGSYIVSFMTDDSHSYRDWNTDPPTYPERWGITLFGDESFDRSKVSEYRGDQDPAVVARISRVRSDAKERIEFRLDKRSSVAVYALGEGTRGEMYDYAWLENASGQVIWEMTYRMTDNAGGASKNRLYQGTLELDAGEYVLYYRTDGSHAFREWNATPPADPESWGVQVAVLD